jgi:hypothetical protein
LHHLVLHHLLLHHHLLLEHPVVHEPIVVVVVFGFLNIIKPKGEFPDLVLLTVTVDFMLDLSAVLT